MAFNLEKLQAIAKPRSEESIQKEEYLKTNKEWLERSKEIALAVHYYLKTQGLTQAALAEKLGVSAPYVAKIMKGTENLTLETICKIESVLGELLVTVAKPYQVQVIPFQYVKFEYSNAENSNKICSEVHSQTWSNTNMDLKRA